MGLSLDLENLNAYALMVDDSLKPIKMSEISCCPNENGDCIYISNALNKDFINTSRYKNNPKIWLLNNPIFRN